MSICKIVVAGIIYVGNLKKECALEHSVGVEKSPEALAELHLEKSAEALAELQGACASQLLLASYPEVELYVDIAIYPGFGRQEPLEVFAYNEEDQLDQALSASLQKMVSAKMEEELRDGAWRQRKPA